MVALLAVGGGAVAVAVLAVGLVLTLRGIRATKPEPGMAAGGPGNKPGPGAVGDSDRPASKPGAGEAPGVPANKVEPAAAPGGPAAATPGRSGVRYVPRESEKRFMKYKEAQGDRRLTEAEVLAVMGEPTRRAPPVTGRREGMTFTVVEVFWEVPGSGISSQMSFVNGLEGGSIIGLEIGPSR